MRLIASLVPIASAGIFRLVLIAAPESCTLDERDVDGSTDAPLPLPPAENGTSAVPVNCTCCGRSVLPTLPECSGKVAFAAPAGDCPKAACKGPTSYILCEGTCYSTCACALPPGFSFVDGGS